MPMLEKVGLQAQLLLSPVIDRSVTTESRFEATGPRQTTLRFGGEGGLKAMLPSLL